MTVRVVIADDHPMYLYGLGAVLAQSTQITVVAAAEDGTELIRAVEQHHPDVVITDLTVPGRDGVSAIRELVASDARLAVLVLTMHEDDEHLFAALRAGARGYLVKGADAQDIERAVLAVAGGDAVYGGAGARRVVPPLPAPPHRPPPPPRSPAGRSRAGSSPPSPPNTPARPPRSPSPSSPPANETSFRCWPPA